MGRGFKKRSNGRQRNGQRRDDRRSQPYADVFKENERLQSYYNTLLELDGNDAEREALWAAFRRELPHSFRFCGSKGHAQSVQKLLKTRYIPELVANKSAADTASVSTLASDATATYEGFPVIPPRPVPWYPDNLAWWTTTSKTVIRKFPPYAAFKRFLVSETSVGNISRQEVVSMIPPLLLDIRPGMAVLDLCAAPGSKAAQLLEMIHQDEEARVRQVLGQMDSGGGRANIEALNESESGPSSQLSVDLGDDGRATGILIANDADYKRSHLLIHQLKRLSSPNLIVTNHDATIFPSLRLPPLPLSQKSADTATVNRRPPMRYLKFDRILADVPCSGDGTLRKNVGMWKDWTPGNALGLHLVQVRILVRALQMLKPGGRVVYSTCSLNPVENESVVATAISLCGGPETVRIRDSSDELPLLQRRPGLKTWPVIDKSGRLWKTWEEVEAYVAESGIAAAGSAENSTGARGIVPSRLVPSMFANANTDHIPLERCLRVYPHLQDTGGFFIAVLEKNAEFKAQTLATNEPEKSAEEAAGDADDDTTAKNAAEADVATNGIDKDNDTGRMKRNVDEPLNGDGGPPSKKLKTRVTEASNTTLLTQATEPAPNGADRAAQGGEGSAGVGEAADEGDDNDGNPNGSPGAGPRRKNNGPYEEPFKYLPADHAVVREVQEFYQLSPRFPADRFMVRNAYGEPAKAIYYTSELVRDILVSNSSSGKPQQQSSGVKFVHGGVRMFVKQEAPSADVCRWRIQSEGLPLLQGYVGRARVVRLWRKRTLRTLLVEMFPKFIDDGDQRRLGEVGAQLPGLGMGCFVLKVGPKTSDDIAYDAEDKGEDSGEDDESLEPMAIPLWKSFHSLNLMLPKEDRAAMLLRIFNDTTPLVNNSLDKDKVKQADKPLSGAQAEGGLVLGAAEPAYGKSQATSVEEEADDYDAENAPSS